VADNLGPVKSHSPWNFKELVWEGPASDANSVRLAVERAADAFPEWSGRDVGERLTVLDDLAGVLADRRDRLVEILIHEAGKAEPDAAAEVDLLAKKIAVTRDLALQRTPLFPVDHRKGEPCRVFRPRGVAAVIGPFNFPLHLVHGLVVPALAVGSTVVVKPSEHVPAVSLAYHECLVEAGLGERVQMVLGGASVARDLVKQERVATVAAVGSRGMGKALQSLLADRPEVVLALELGGVNHALVRADADPEATVAALAEGAWRMAGQRCTATRIAHVPAKDADGYLRALKDARIPWTDNERVGPLISAQAQHRFHQAFAKPPTGLEVVASTAQISEDSAHVPPVLLRVLESSAREHQLYTHEHFGPYLIVDPYDDEDLAVARMRRNPYRLAASVFTADHDAFRRLARELPYGQVNHDRQTAGARSDMPFGGCGRSGNGHPAALAACEIFADETVIW